MALMNDKDQKNFTCGFIDLPPNTPDGQDRRCLPLAQNYYCKVGECKNPTPENKDKCEKIGWYYNNAD